MTNLIIDPTRGLVSLGPDGEEHEISVPAGFSANHCVLMVEPAFMGNGGHDVRSAFLLEEGYEGLVTDAENIYDLVSESSNPFYHFNMPTDVLQHVHVLNSGAAEEMDGVFEIKNIENPGFSNWWDGSTKTIMYFYPDVIVTDRHILKYNNNTYKMRILSEDYGIGSRVVSVDYSRIISNYDYSKIEVITRWGDAVQSIDKNGGISRPRYESSYVSGSVSDVINFNGYAVYAVEVDGASNGGMVDVFDPWAEDLLEIPHPQNLPVDAEVVKNSSFKFFKSPDNKRLFVLSVVETTFDGSQDESEFVVIHEVLIDLSHYETTLREIYCENMGTVLGKLEPRVDGDMHPMNYLHYHEYGILSISDSSYWPPLEHMRVLEIVGDSDEITISDFAAAEYSFSEIVQPNATAVVSAYAPPD